MEDVNLKKAIYIGILFILILGFPAIGTAGPEYSMVWGSSGVADFDGTVYSLWVGNTDNDTKEEIIAGTDYRGGGLWVFETDGDNSFTEVWSQPTTSVTYYGVCTGDADKDGKQEIIGGGYDGTGGIVLVYEWTGTVGQNDYEQVWTRTLSDTLEGVCVADDLDKDGNREIVIGSRDGLVSVFECTGDDAYALDWSFDVTTQGASNVWDCECGDIDDDNWIEIAVECNLHVLVLNSSTTQATAHLEWGPTFLPATGAYTAIDVSIEKDGFSQDLDNDGLKEIVVGCDDQVAIYENLAPNSYGSTPVSIPFVDTNRIRVDIAWDLDGNNKNELLCGGGYPGNTYNVSIFEFGSTLEDFSLVWTTTLEESVNAIRASERFCHRDLDREVENLQEDEGYWEFVVGLYYTAAEDLQVYESDILAGHIPEFQPPTGARIRMQVGASATKIKTGESVEVNVTLENTGTEPAEGIEVTMTINATGLTITEGYKITNITSLDADQQTILNYRLKGEGEGSYNITVKVEGENFDSSEKSLSVLVEKPEAKPLESWVIAIIIIAVLAIVLGPLYYLYRRRTQAITKPS